MNQGNSVERQLNSKGITLNKILRRFMVMDYLSVK